MTFARYVIGCVWLALVAIANRVVPDPWQYLVEAVGGLGYAFIFVSLVHRRTSSSSSTGGDRG